MAKSNLNELANLLMEKHRVSKTTAQLFLNSIVSCIQDGIDVDKQVKIKGLGTFKIVDVEARESVDVNTGERVTIESHQKLSFIPDAQMKALVNKPFELFETVVLNDDNITGEPETTAEEESVVEEEPDVEYKEPGDAGNAGNPRDAETSLEEEGAEKMDSNADSFNIELAEEEAGEEESETEEDSVEEEPSTEADSAEEEGPAIEIEPTEEEEPATEENPEEEEKSATEANSEEEEKSATEANSEEEEESATEANSEEEEEVFAENVEENLPEEEIMTLGDSMKPGSPALADNQPTVSEDAKASGGWKHWLPAACLALVIGFFAGYFVGRNNTAPFTEKAAPVTAESVQAQAPAEDETASGAEGTSAPTDNDTPANTDAPSASAGPQSADEPIWEKYNNMDTRTRDGYYFITGFDRNYTVKEGDNLKKIAKSVFGGADMSCYIEVYNNVNASTELTPGMVLKIPKIEPKKSVRRRLEQNNQ